MAHIPLHCSLALLRQVQALPVVATSELFLSSWSGSKSSLVDTPPATLSLPLMPVRAGIGVFVNSRVPGGGHAGSASTTQGATVQAGVPPSSWCHACTHLQLGGGGSSRLPWARICNESALEAGLQFLASGGLRTIVRRSGSTGEAPCSATGFCADFLTPFRGPRKYQFLL